MNRLVQTHSGPVNVPPEVAEQLVELGRGYDFTGGSAHSVPHAGTLEPLSEIQLEMKRGVRPWARVKIVEPNPEPEPEGTPPVPEPKSKRYKTREMKAEK